jgi:cytochrome c peroxidase
MIRLGSPACLQLPRACRLSLLGLCLMLAGVAVAERAPALSEFSPTNPLADREPITPIPPPPAADPRKLALGERLFNDPRLSAEGNLSCSSCHDLRTNGAGRGNPPHGSSIKLNILTMFNASFNFRLNWEGNFRSLRAQAESSLENPANLHTSADEVAVRLNADPAIASEFRAAFGHAADRDSVLDALVTFEESLVTPGSRFDRWLTGDTSALSHEELTGYRLFKSLGCSSCHQGRNVGGNLFAKQGVFRPLVEGSPEIVRVPSLRNVATTAPYFHDGSAATLEEAVRRMAAAQLDRTVTDQQVASVVAFLRTLTGNYRGSAVTGATP